jgi:hypothetical protein
MYTQMRLTSSNINLGVCAYAGGLLCGVVENEKAVQFSSANLICAVEGPCALSVTYSESGYLYVQGLRKEKTSRHKLSGAREFSENGPPMHTPPDSSPNHRPR